MRNRIRVLHVKGRAGFGLSEDDYTDPWKATRALVFWFALLLDEVGGDLDRATGAYHVGSGRSRSPRARAYRDEVTRLESAYVKGRSPSPTWAWLRAQSPSPCPLPGAPSTSPELPGEDRSDVHQLAASEETRESTGRHLADEDPVGMGDHRRSDR